jgi:hypothetical protein
MNWKTIIGTVTAVGIVTGGVSILTFQTRESKLQAFADQLTVADGGITFTTPIFVPRMQNAPIYDSHSLPACNGNMITSRIAVNDAKSDVPGSVYVGGGFYVIGLQCTYSSSGAGGMGGAAGTGGRGGTSGASSAGGASGASGIGGTSGKGGTSGAGGASGAGGTSGTSSVAAYLWKVGG